MENTTMENTTTEASREYTGELIHIIVEVPVDTIACGFTVIRLVNGELKEAHMDMTAEAFRQARQDFLDNVECGDDYDKVYVLSDKGREYLEQKEKGEKS